MLDLYGRRGFFFTRSAQRFFTRPMKPGFHVPPRLERVLRPAVGLTTEDALQELREAVERFESASQLAVHPAFGPLTREEWTLLTLRHAELHMSFVLSAEHEPPSLGCSGLSRESPWSSPLQSLEPRGVPARPPRDCRA